MEENKLNHFVYSAPYFHKLFGERISVGLSDREKFLVSLDSSELKMPIKVGDPVKEGTASYAVIKEGREITKKVDKNVYGVSWIARSTPIKNEKDMVLGVLTIAEPTTLQEDLNELTGKITHDIDLLEISTANVAATSQEFAATVSTLAQNSEEIREKMEVMESILNLIREVSDKTHLLGLNAAIEAARAGEAGLGFKVVAEETRKLATKTKDSLKQINEEMKKVLGTVELIASNAQQIAATSEEQAASTVEIGKAAHDLKEESQRLMELSQKLINK